MNKRFLNKVVIVTGSGSGTGKAIAIKISLTEAIASEVKNYNITCKFFFEKTA